jgi:hypothetical protein
MLYFRTYTNTNRHFRWGECGFIQQIPGCAGIGHSGDVLEKRVEDLPLGNPEVLVEGGP